jgi:methionine-rich copper-binding protein CopC
MHKNRSKASTSRWRSHPPRGRRQGGSLRVPALLLLLLAATVFSAGRGAQVAHAAPCDPPISNPIVCENSKTGNPDTEWDISGSGDPSIQGFATDISYNVGQTVSFKVKTTASSYRLDIYRMGYYNGMGARKIATVNPSVALPQSQPACLTDAATGLIDCGNWAASASWTIPSDAVSGIYFAHLVRQSGPAGDSHIHFIVRDDASTSDLLFQTDDTTWQAYNAYGGNSLYEGTAPSSDGRAYKVSYNRPFATRGQAGGFGPANFVFYAEYPMVRWLESNGYNVSYFSGVDTDRRGTLIKNHKVFMSTGHDEYWSGGARTNVEAARAAGVHLAFFSGNEVFWKTRWENAIDGSGTPYRTLVCYKETKVGAKIDPNPAWTGTWRDPRFSPPADGGKPENGLMGTIFTVNRGTADIQVTAADGKMRLWRNTSIANLGSGQVATLSQSTLGYEWDEDLDNGFRPAGTIQLSTTTVSVPEHLIDYGNTYVPATVTHHITLYRHSSGALVFSAGTVQWAWGLDPNHDTNPDSGSDTADVRMQQAMVNLLADMGVQPGTLQSGLVAASQSTDATKPTSTITSPANNGSVQQGATVTITGTAADSGGVVGGVEVSLDGGTTWHPASGRGNWTYTWVPTAPGTVTIKSRAADDSGNVETVGAGITVTVTPRTCPCSIWAPSATPAQPSAGDSQAIEVGLKLKTDVDGYVTGVRFYKGTGNTGTHTGSLWTSSGTLLATGTFSNETASGWQQLTFNAPVPINANITYVVSYHTNTGHYAADAGYFTAGVDNYPLHALSDAAASGNGVYAYSGSSTYPSQNFNATNYWVDVVFDTSANDTIPPAVSGQTPAPNAVQVPQNTTVTATFSEPVQSGTISFVLKNPSNVTVPATMTYDAPSRTATLTPNAALAQSTTYTATVSGAKDIAGNPMSAPVSWSFTTTGPATSIWLPSATPATASVNDPQQIELGLKFKSDIDGYINGVRLYKGATNTGTHTGHLWTSAGTLLASVTFVNESATGWQQALFSTPVAITANTTYVVSYWTSSGNYAITSNAFAAAGVDNYPLHALSNAAASGNGIYRYGASGFPSTSYNSTNYWVDVVFATTFVDTVPPTVTAQSPASGATKVAPTTTVTATFSEPVQSGTISFVLKDAQNNTVPSSTSYTAATQTATLTPNAALAYGATYTATLSGAADPSGNVMAAVTWSFTTVACPCTLFAATATPANPSANDPTAIEVGVKFTSAIDGYITGVRFYKGSSNTGTHIGNLWTGTGTLLGTVTFNGETASGWQQANFPGPIAVTAGTTYVVSYWTSSGNYAADAGYFSAAVDSWPLNAPASGNGVYGYAASSTFPTSTYNSTNYWVDAVFSTSSADTTPPTVTSRTPASGATGVPTTTTVTATFSEAVQSGTISFVLKDAQNNTVASTTAYNSGTRTVTLTPNAALAFGATYTATVSGAADPSGNVMTTTSWSFTTATAATSIWSASTVPGTPSANDAQAIEVGVKFKSDLNGYINGIRFYKGSGNTGTHIGNLWTSSGTLLATATFTGETATGWQQVLFSTPVAITANTVYVASYWTSSGNYAADGGYFANGVDNFPLHALSNAAASGNGVYKYGSTSSFPTNSYNSANYWVDVVFGTTLNDTVAPTVTSRTPAAGATAVATTTTVTATFSEPVQSGTISFVLKNPGNQTVAASVTYDAPSRTATLTPSAALAQNTTYTATVSGTKDTAGNTMTSTSWSFTTVACPCTIWAPSATPSTPSANDPQAVEVGVKFKADMNGTITGIRFYKGSANTGTHTVNLWTSGGTLLATANSSGETASGWQQVNFASPVAITANTVYVASYWTSSGNYSVNGGYFVGQGVDNPPLHALADGVSGGNGVFKYGTSGFPTSTYNGGNYWVDVVFNPS